MATFTSSGFEAAATGPIVPQSLAQPTIKKVDHGNTGEFVVKIKPVPKARIYELRFAPQTGGTFGAWTIVLFPSVRDSVYVNGLTPGTIYALQVRAAGLLGYTDWSDALTRMCT